MATTLEKEQLIRMIKSPYPKPNYTLEKVAVGDYLVTVRTEELWDGRNLRTIVSREKVY